MARNFYKFLVLQILDFSKKNNLAVCRIVFLFQKGYYKGSKIFESKQIYNFIFMKLARFSFFLFVLLVSVLSTTTALAQTSGAVTCPPGTAPSGTGLCFPNATGLSNAPISTIIQSFLYWLLGIFGFLAVIAFVISGIQYLTSAGNDKQVETAKKNMQYSIIGVIVALGGLVVILAVGEALSGASTMY